MKEDEEGSVKVQKALRSTTLSGLYMLIRPSGRLTYLYSALMNATLLPRSFSETLELENVMSERPGTSQETKSIRTRHEAD